MSIRPARGLTAIAALGFAALILYASLYPFSGWRWPPGRGLSDLLALPWPPYRIPFDIVSNLVGYLPLGLLGVLAVRAGGGGILAALAVGIAAGAGLSYVVEVVQHFLPGRHPSLLDWALNTGGATVGALLGLAIRGLGWPERLRRATAAWMPPDAVGAVSLLLIWPAALLFPTAVPLGLGQVGPRLKPWLAGWLEGVPWAETWHAALTASGPAVATPGAPTDAVLTALGLLAPCLVAFSVVPSGWRRVGLAVGAPLLASGVLTLSTALNFGPEHAATWVTPGTVPALIGGTLLAVACAALPRRLAAPLGLVAVTAGVILASQVPADPYLADSLQGWEQGRFIRFHGLAQWVGWLWPYAAGLWLLRRTGQRR